MDQEVISGAGLSSGTRAGMKLGATVRPGGTTSGGEGLTALMGDHSRQTGAHPEWKQERLGNEMWETENGYSLALKGCGEGACLQQSRASAQV